MTQKSQQLLMFEEEGILTYDRVVFRNLILPFLILLNSGLYPCAIPAC